MRTRARGTPAGPAPGGGGGAWATGGGGAPGVPARGDGTGVVGRGLAYGGVDSRAARWTAGAVVLAPAVAGYAGSSGLAINAAGAVAGVLVDSLRPGRPFLWRAGASGAVELLDLGGPGEGDATALSDRGDAAGTVGYRTGPGAGHDQAVVWRRGRAPRLFAGAQG